jgi:hypothetical protein
MDSTAVLAQGILDQLPDQPGPILLAGPLPLARAIEPKLASLILVNHRTKAAKLARQRTGPLTVLRADPTLLPIVPRSLAALIAVDVFGRLSCPRQDVLMSWSRSLSVGGMLLVVERVGWSRTMHRLASGGRVTPVAPEELTARFLNAGYCQIRQIQTAASMLITSGCIRFF